MALAVCSAMIFHGDYMGTVDLAEYLGQQKKGLCFLATRLGCGHSTVH